MKNRPSFEPSTTPDASDFSVVHSVKVAASRQAKSACLYRLIPQGALAVVRINVLDDMVSELLNGLIGLVASNARGDKEAMFVNLLLII